ncbi:MAG: TlpA family protein disulfide reductase [Bacteroidales bacterium]|nr:TlpA family protein disulfide reductase [Bacteroidales bacterium]
MKSIISTFLLLVVLTGCVKERQTGADLKVGDSLPDFEVTMNDGIVMSDDSLKRSVSVVMFFHTSCGDCQQVLPQMQQVYDEYIDKGVLFAFISREDSGSSVASFWKEKGLNMPYSAQTDRKVYEKFARERIPRVYICEKGGIIRYIHTDNPVPSYDDLRNSLESLIH